jgi:hypothetical protein
VHDREGEGGQACTHHDSIHALCGGLPVMHKDNKKAGLKRNPPAVHDDFVHMVSRYGIVSYVGESINLACRIIPCMAYCMLKTRG